MDNDNRSQLEDQPPEADAVDAVILCAYSEPGMALEDAPCLSGCSGPMADGCERVLRLIGTGNHR